jgi:putative ABC transport system substrate-binding protein
MAIERYPARQQPMRALAAGLLTLALAMQAHAATPRIGFLSPSTPEGSEFVIAAFRKGLEESGYIVGTNIAIEARYANDRFEDLPRLARELVASNVDVLATYVTQASVAGKRATATIPIVMISVSDPVASGLVPSLSRPGGNVTGTSAPFTGSAGKALQFLKEAIPKAQRVAVVWNPGNSVFQAQVLEETHNAAQSLGIELSRFEARDAQSLERALAAIAEQRFAAVSILPDPVFAASWARIAALTQSLRLPSVTVSSSYAEAGGLLTYGPSIPQMARKSAGYVAKILRGASPGGLPVEQSNDYELVINLRTAKQIGVAMPQSLRLHANRLIE